MSNIFQTLIKNKYWWIFTIIFFIAVTYLASLIHYKIDLTKEKRFSISNSTKDLLKNLDDEVEVEVFLTGNLSAGFKKLSIATKELLENLRDYSNGNLHFTFKKPGEGLSDSSKLILYDSLVRLGVKPFNNQVQTKSSEEQTERLIFPSAIVKYKNKLLAVDLMSGKSGYDEESTLNYSEALLEFKLIDAIHKLSRKNFPVVAYAVGNGEPLNPTVRDLITLASNNYRFGIFDLQNGILNADTIKTLLVVKPSIPFTEKEKIKIDQYIMQGGNVIWMIDRLYAEFDSLLRSKSDFVAYDKELNIDDQLFKYGVRINRDLVQDINAAKQPLVVGNSGNKPQIERVPFPYYPLLSSTSNHPISKNLDFVLSIFPSSIDTVKATEIQKTVLLETDTMSRTLGTPAMVSLKNIQDVNDIRNFPKSHIAVSVLLEGKFNSLYANRISNELKDSVSLWTGGIPFILSAKKSAKQIVTSDADIVTNVITQTNGALPMGTQEFENYQFANRDFFMNALAYLAGDIAILETRNKDFTLRLLDKNKVEENKTIWQLINITVPIFLIIMIGFIVQWRRKKKYAV